MSMTLNARLASAYEYIASHPRSTKLMLGTAMGWRHQPDYEVEELERRSLVRRVALQKGEQIDGRYATVASKLT